MSSRDFRQEHVAHVCEPAVAPAAPGRRVAHARALAGDRAGGARVMSPSRSYSSYSYSYSRSPSPDKAKGGGREPRGRSPDSRERGRSPDSRERGPRRGKPPVPKILHVSNLTRNVTADHLREIFGMFGTVKNVELAIDGEVQLPKGYAFVELEEREHCEAAIEHMDGGQVDGQKVSVHIMGQGPRQPLPPRGRGGPPPPPPRDGRPMDYGRRGPPPPDYGRRGPPPPPPRRDRSPPRRRSRSPPRRSRSPPPRRDDRRDPPRRRSRSRSPPRRGRGRSPSRSSSYSD